MNEGFKKRSIETDGVMDVLRDASKQPGLWADVLADPELTIAIRDERIHVYWLQQQLLELKVQGKNLRFTTHPKFLCDARIPDPKVSGKVRFEAPHFRQPRWKQYEFFTEYVPGGSTLQRMKQAAAMYAKHPEKRGVHVVARVNPHVLDVEFRFEGKYAPDTESGVLIKDPQIDLVVLKRRRGEIEVAFWEAKHVINHRSLKARNGQGVRDQIAVYRNAITRNRSGILSSFPKLAGNLTEISRMRPQQRFDSVIQDAAKGMPLTISDPPSVGLLILGEPAPSNDEPWLKKLRETEDVLVYGDPKDARLPT